jgi:hypothetical protein
LSPKSAQKTGKLLSTSGAEEKEKTKADAVEENYRAI